MPVKCEGKSIEQTGVRTMIVANDCSGYSLQSQSRLSPHGCQDDLLGVLIQQVRGQAHVQMTLSFVTTVEFQWFLFSNTSSSWLP